MNKYKEIEKELNKEAVPLYFHDMSVVNMRFNGDKIQIRLVLAKYLDEFNILEDDNHFAILEVVYEGINITKMYLEGLIDFRDVDIYTLCENEDGTIEMNLRSDTYDFYFNTIFSFKSYKWKLVDIISYDEYCAFGNSLIDGVDYIDKLQENVGPDWSRFEE